MYLGHISAVGLDNKRLHIKQVAAVYSFTITQCCIADSCMTLFIHFRIFLTLFYILLVLLLSICFMSVCRLF